MKELNNTIIFPCGAKMKNRFMLAPLTNTQSHEDGILSDEEFHWLTMRAKGQFGLVMTCASHVQAVGKGFPGQLGTFDDKHLEGHIRLAKAIQAHGSLAVLQLHHAGMRSDPKLIEGGKKRLHKFHQKVPIQSYLIAIAAGKLESRKIGPRSTVWSEELFVDKAAHEFSETEHMLQKAEELCGPYNWGVYDILVLPPSFPYGGMENPCLTFATSTLLVS